MPTAKESKTMAEDLVSLHGAIPTMPKDAINPFFKSKYTPYDTIKETCQPILAKYNFAWVTIPSFNESGEPTLKYRLIHASGESIDGEMLILPGKRDPQGQGSAITYARRYSLSSVLDIVSDEDDDGNAARKAAEDAKSQLQTTPPVMKTIDPPSPEEPSVQLDEDNAEELKTVMSQLRAKLEEKGYTDPTMKVGFVETVLGKPVPKTVDEYKLVLETLEEVPF